MSKYGRGKIGEAKVAAILEGIEGPHYLFHDVTLRNLTSEMSHQIDHILIHPHGVFVIETKNYFGQIEVDPSTNDWFKTVRGRKERIFSPLRQNKSHAITLRKLSKSKIHPIPVTVFASNNAPYLPDDNVINASDLLLFIDSYPYERLFTKREMEEAYKLIASFTSDISLEEHLENIAILRQVRKEEQAEMTYAIERGLCPRCNHQIEEKDYHYFCPKCGYSFKLS